MIFFLCLLLTIFLTKISLPFLKRFFLVPPDSRSSHQVSKPSAGGIVFVSLICLISFFQKFYLPILCLPLSIIGLMDDKFDIKPSFRILAQIITTILFFHNSPLVNSLLNNNNNFISLVLIFTIVFFSLGIINFINFLDGLDGLLASCMIIVFLITSIYLNINIIPVIACLLGFLFFNWGESKLFMGDVGSTFLGALFVGICLQTQTFYDAFNVVLFASPLLGDALISVIRRFLSGKSITTAHKSFFFQRLNQGGLKHQSVSLIYLSATSINAIMFLLGGIKFLFLIIIAEFFIALYLDKKVAIKYK